MAQSQEAGRSVIVRDISPDCTEIAFCGPMHEGQGTAEGMLTQSAVAHGIAFVSGLRQNDSNISRAYSYKLGRAENR